MGSNSSSQYVTPLFRGIKAGEYLPLGEGGLLVHYQQDPGYFLDIHGVVMESDSDVREYGEILESVRSTSGLAEMLARLSDMSGFNPQLVQEARFVISTFIDLLVEALKSNDDDHVATFHDFYLRQQGFGQGRHPAENLAQIQDVWMAYTIDVQ